MVLATTQNLPILRVCRPHGRQVPKRKLSAKNSYASVFAGKKPAGAAANKLTKTTTTTTTTPTNPPEPRVKDKATTPSQTGRIEADKGRGSSIANSLSPATPNLDAIVLVTPLSPTRCSNRFGVLASLPSSEGATPVSASGPDLPRLLTRRQAGRRSAIAEPAKAMTLREVSRIPTHLKPISKSTCLTGKRSPRPPKPLASARIARRGVQ